MGLASSLSVLLAALAAALHGGHEQQARPAVPDAPSAARAALERRRAREEQAEIVWRDGHGSSPARALALSPDGARLATADADGFVVLWDALLGEASAVLGPFAGEAAAFDAPAFELSWAGERLLVLGRAASRAWLVDAREGRRLGLLGEEDDSVLCAALEPKGERAALGLADGRVLVVAVLEDEPGRVLAHERLAEEALIALAWSGEQLVARTAAGEALRFDPGAAPGDPSRVLAASAEESLLLAAAPRPGTEATSLVLATQDGRRALLASASGEARLIETRSGTTIVALEGLRAPLACASFDRAGRTLAALDEKGRVLVWPLALGRAGARSPLELAGLARGQSARAPSLARASPGAAVTEELVLALPSRAPHEDGRVLAQVWSLASGRLHALLAEPAGHELEWARLGESPTGPLWLAAARSAAGEPRLLLGELGASEGEARAHALEGLAADDGIVALELSHDARRLLVASRRSGLWLLEREEARVVARFREAGPFADGSPALALCPGGDALAFAGREPGSLFVWVESRDEKARRLEGHAATPSALGFVPRVDAGLRLASADRDGRLFLWEAHSGARLLALEEPAPLAALALDSAGELVASAALDGKGRVRSLSDGRLVHALELGQGPLERIAFAPDGTRLVALEREGLLATARLGERARVLRHGLVEGRALAACFSADGRRILVACADGAQRVLAAESGTLLATRAALGDGEWLAYASSGHFLASERALALPRLRRAGGATPLLSWAELLRSPEQLARALSGEPPPRPFLPEPPVVEILRPASGAHEERALVLEARTRGAFALASLELALDGELVPDAFLRSVSRSAQEGRRLELSLPLSLAPGRATTVSFAARDERGTASRPVRLALQLATPERELWVLAPAGTDEDRLVERLRREAPGLFTVVRVERYERGAAAAELARLRAGFLAEARPRDALFVLAPSEEVLEAVCAGFEERALVACVDEPRARERQRAPRAGAARALEAASGRTARAASLLVARTEPARSVAGALLAVLAGEDGLPHSSTPSGAAALDARELLERARLVLERSGTEVELELGDLELPLARAR